MQFTPRELLAIEKFLEEAELPTEVSIVQIYKDYLKRMLKIYKEFPKDEVN